MNVAGRLTNRTHSLLTLGIGVAAVALAAVAGCRNPTPAPAPGAPERAAVAARQPARP